MLNSTASTVVSSYSRNMSPEPMHARAVDQPVDDLWTAWQARGAANDRATRRRLFIMAGILIFSVAMVSALSFLR